MAEWRNEVLEAVDEVLKHSNRGGQGEWKPLGKVVSQGDGWYALDLHTGNRRPPSADSFDQLCFADKEGPERGTPIPVERSQITDEILKVQAAGRLPDGCDILWTVRLTPHHLWRKLRDGIAASQNAKLADRLAEGQLDRVPSPKGDYPPGFLPSQRQAYLACIEPGLHAVWGPPGTGKTRVLARAIEDLVKQGKRVLLASTANVAVDNALKEVIKHLRPTSGQVIRVGPPHLRDLVDNDDVQLSRLAARTTAEVDAERQRVQEELDQLNAMDTRLDDLNKDLSAYDHSAYTTAQQRIATTRALESRQADLHAVQIEHEQVDRELSAATSRLQSAIAEAERVAPQRAELQRVHEMTERLAELDRKVERERADTADVEYTVSTAGGGWWAKRRNRRIADVARTGLEILERHVVTQHGILDPLIARSRAAAYPITDEHIARIDNELQAEQDRHGLAERQTTAVAKRMRELRTLCDQLARRGVATEADIDLVTIATRRNLPGKYEQREKLRTLQRKKNRDKTNLEERLRELNKRIAKLRRDAEGEIVAQARVVATTLARSRAHPAVAREQFDVVLVDEAGAAVLGEVLLAVSRARTTATLLGDFLQLGPVTGDMEKSKKQVVRKWLVPDAFAHCGIRTPEDVADSIGCVGLLHQFRFGPNLRRLANDVVYGVLEDGITKVSGRPPADTEIVLVDVDGLPDLNRVHRSGKFAGWWPVGALLSRSLVEHHAVDSEGVGVVATFKQQVEATHATLRDAGQNLIAPVGTAHSFQGREFDTVVFDLVEDGQGWISVAKWKGDDFARNGVRLFGVGITRARKRLYVIANGSLAVKGAIGGTPLGALRELGAAKGVQWCRAGVLLGMTEQASYNSVSRVEAELHDVLRGLVEVTDIDDEFSFDDALEKHLSSIRSSLWMWSPWVAKKSARFLLLISAAVARNVDVRVFVRTERDANMRKEHYKHWVTELMSTGAKVIRSEVEHRKVVVVDRRTVLLGSHNALSQHRSREMMITCRGAAFAERILGELQAEVHGNPPPCEKCGRDFELWRSGSRRKDMPYFWRCHFCKVDSDVVIVKR